MLRFPRKLTADPNQQVSYIPLFAIEVRVEHFSNLAVM